MLTEDLTRILDEMAPIRTIQMRENYAPWLSPRTCLLMTDRDNTQKTAAITNTEEDWKL